MEIHRILGGGLSEVVYKDALEYELTKADILFWREKEYVIHYKDIVLKHKFYADFVVYHDIILEIKVAKNISDQHITQTINYVRLAGGQLGIIINFNESTLQFKRIVV